MTPTAGPIAFEAVMRTAATKLAAFDRAHPRRDSYPTDAKGPHWRTVKVHDWESGFYPGCLWYLYEYARDAGWDDSDRWLRLASDWTESLESQQFNNTHHDLGFVMFDSYGNGFRLTGRDEYKPILIQSALSLASRFSETTGMIRSWGDIDDMESFTVIIDNMMNLELLLWASRNGGPETLREIVVRHADRTIETFFRPDGSTCHVVELDARDGSFLRQKTHQGKADGSTWSRGQAWAIYGFAYLYQELGERRYLDASLRAAEHYLDRLPTDGIPPADFDGGHDGIGFKDSSAAAVVASAFLRLAAVLDDPAQIRRYLDAAVSMLGALTRPPYFSESPADAGLLLHGARNHCEDSGHLFADTSLIWGEYYLLESLVRLHQQSAADPPA
ncbi:MAG: glycoside hydrolase family 88 protein [Akkermansiaceae bacterium]|nr:glycoside hydrolase family 88 protein [Akkermansiaceae bacterium]MCP5543512.1 glycoside hydrolase family 88 protein [Akkermansiaceae bacterium]MCP5546850.1 glycoside hydrolase family 88 protein [Akkermansiaceae bacterium]